VLIEKEGQGRKKKRKEKEKKTYSLFFAKKKKKKLPKANFHLFFFLQYEKSNGAAIHSSQCRTVHPPETHLAHECLHRLSGLLVKDLHLPFLAVFL